MDTFKDDNMKNILEWAVKGKAADEEINKAKLERDFWRNEVDKWRGKYNNLMVKSIKSQGSKSAARNDSFDRLSPHSVQESVVSTSQDNSSRPFSTRKELN